MGGKIGGVFLVLVVYRGGAFDTTVRPTIGGTVDEVLGGIYVHGRCVILRLCLVDPVGVDESYTQIERLCIGW